MNFPGSFLNARLKSLLNTV